MEASRSGCSIMVSLAKGRYLGRDYVGRRLSRHVGDPLDRLQPSEKRADSFTPGAVVADVARRHG